MYLLIFVSKHTASSCQRFHTLGYKPTSLGHHKGSDFIPPGNLIDKMIATTPKAHIQTFHDKIFLMIFSWYPNPRPSYTIAAIKYNIDQCSLCSCKLKFIHYDLSKANALRETLRKPLFKFLCLPRYLYI